MIWISKFQPATEKGDSREQFHDEIARRNGRAAIFTFAAEPKPRHERNVQVKWNRVFAMRAMRRRRDDAQFQRHPVNADVQKAADDAAERKKANRPEMKRNERPIFR